MKKISDLTNKNFIPYVEEFVLPKKWDIVATKETVDDSWKIQRLVAFLKGEIDVLNFNK